jgi:hypothetical protein
MKFASKVVQIDSRISISIQEICEIHSSLVRVPYSLSMSYFWTRRERYLTLPDLNKTLARFNPNQLISQSMLCLLTKIHFYILSLRLITKKMQSIAFELEFIFTSIISKRKDATISQVEKSEFDCELNSSSSEVF